MAAKTNYQREKALLASVAIHARGYHTLKRMQQACDSVSQFNDNKKVRGIAFTFVGMVGRWRNCADLCAHNYYYYYYCYYHQLFAKHWKESSPGFPEFNVKVRAAVTSLHTHTTLTTQPPASPHLYC